MGDAAFMKLYVCASNGWNPFDENIRRIPQEFWAFAYRLDDIRKYMDWKEVFEPHGELIAHIANPEMFKVYSEHKKKLERSKDGATEVSVGNTTYVTATHHLDPNKGLVDEKGNIIMSKEKYLENLGMSGILKDN